MSIKKLLRENIMNEALELYHGSIHSFEGFDLNNVGSGDGNDVHGYGLYFTDSEEVAQYYANVYRGDRDKYIYTVKIFRNNFLEWDGYIDESDAHIIYGKLQRVITNEDELQSMQDVLGLSEDYYGEYPWVQQLYSHLSETLGSKKAASQFLDNCGYDGIIFQSKESGTNANNYVIFDQNNIKILDQRRA